MVSVHRRQQKPLKKKFQQRYLLNIKRLKTKDLLGSNGLHQLKIETILANKMCQLIF